MPQEDKQRKRYIPTIKNAPAHNVESGPMYTIIDVKNPNSFAEMGKGLANARPIGMAKGDRWRSDFSNLSPGISGRPGFSKEDYYAFRPDEAVPTEHHDIMCMADAAYNNIGLVQNIVNLMADFTVQGMRVVHPSPQVQKWCQNWWMTVQGQERSERFANMFYRLGNVFVRKITAKVKQSVREQLYKSTASPDMVAQIDIPYESKEIPWKYVFFDPRIVVVAAGPLAAFAGKSRYGIMLPETLRKQINSPTPEEAPIVAQLPEDIKAAARTNLPYFLPANKISAFFYRKDDWRDFAYPMSYSVMDDLINLEKMKLADRAALDGAISKVRIFKIGNFEYGVSPTTSCFDRLSSILEANVAGGTKDFVWGPDIEIIETNSTSYEFLGPEKYEPILNAIHQGYGIPPTLTATYGSSGTTNNFISLKTLTERLEYGRQALASFWREEFKALQQGMGFRIAPTLEFTHVNVVDDVAEKALWIQLYDRNLVSDEYMQTYFGNDPAFEQLRMNREERQRISGRRQPKSGPFFNPEIEADLVKIALQAGLITPGEAGIELEERLPGEKSGQEVQVEMDKQKLAEKKAGVPGQGRPLNKKDSTKRKTKEFKPKSKAVELWAEQAYEKIGEILTPVFLKVFDKKNMRQLTNAEAEMAEDIRFGVLLSLKPFAQVEEVHVKANIQTEVPEKVAAYYVKCLNSVQETSGQILNLVECRKVRAFVYAIVNKDKVTHED